MPKVHRVGDPRIDGAVTINMPPLNTKVFVEGMLAAVVGNLDTHNMLGALISMSPGKVLVQGVPLITSLMDQAAPDMLGIILHPEGIPTPAGGSTKVTAYGGLGTFGGGLGSFGLTGLPGVGEIMQMGSQVMGQVSRSNGSGGNGGVLIMSNMNPSVTPPGPGDTVTSTTTGKTFTFSNYYSS